MFTGIIRGVGEIVGVGTRIFVKSPFNADIGASVAVNGCCLTHTGGTDLTFDLSAETLERTTLGAAQIGQIVNLEPAIRAGEELGGHFVLGHVDGIGELVEVEQGSSGKRFRFRVPEGKYLVDKGSIAIDGISLTVVNPSDREFDAWIIPHTEENTTLKSLSIGDKVNVEYDVLSRYLERLLANQ